MRVLACLALLAGTAAQDGALIELDGEAPVLQWRGGSRRRRAATERDGVPGRAPPSPAAATLDDI